MLRPRQTERMSGSRQPKLLGQAWKALTSLKLTIVALVALMILVIGCTLAQVDLGSFAAVQRFMNCFVVWAHLPGTTRRIPVFPGGALVGLVLLLNLVAAQVSRLQLKWSKSGIWIIHAGLVLLLAGQFVTGLLQTEMRLPIEVGETSNFLESPRNEELILSDVTDPKAEEEFAIPDALLGREKSIEVKGTPLRLEVKAFLRNSSFSRLAPGDPPPLATAGVGAAITLKELPPVTADDEMDQRAVLVEPIADGRSYGTWLVSSGLGAPQSFLHEGHKYFLSMRAQREYLPYSLTLKKFTHDVYLGTDIPKNFASLVHLSNPEGGEDRDVLIYMNHPLRYRGKAFYQASFGKDDKLSILQVVDNPGWLLPYIACVLVGLGLLVHFSFTMRRSLGRKRPSGEAFA
jgi:ResB-like family